jgi:GNAT superfamily N-acetyltransferase
VEIRGIRQDEGEAVGDLWDRLCREDGGALSAAGHRNLSRMLAMSAWHRDAFCLVAVDGDDLVGFVNGRVGSGDGLLPGLLGEIDSLYVQPEQRGHGLSRGLIEAAVALLRERGADTIRYLSSADAVDDHQLWQGLGFAPDMVCLSLYRDQQ